MRELIFGGIMYKNNHQKFGNIFPENSIAPLQVLPFREAFIYVEEFNVYKT